MLSKQDMCVELKKVLEDCESVWNEFKFANTIEEFRKKWKVKPISHKTNFFINLVKKLEKLLDLGDVTLLFRTLLADINIKHEEFLRKLAEFESSKGTLSGLNNHLLLAKAYSEFSKFVSLFMSCSSALKDKLDTPNQCHLTHTLGLLEEQSQLFNSSELLVLNSWESFKLKKKIDDSREIIWDLLIQLASTINFHDDQVSEQINQLNWIDLKVKINQLIDFYYYLKKNPNLCNIDPEELLRIIYKLIPDAYLSEFSKENLAQKEALNGSEMEKNSRLCTKYITRFLSNERIDHFELNLPSPIHFDDDDQSHYFNKVYYHLRDQLNNINQIDNFKFLSYKIACNLVARYKEILPMLNLIKDLQMTFKSFKLRDTKPNNSKLHSTKLIELLLKHETDAPAIKLIMDNLRQTYFSNSKIYDLSEKFSDLIKDCALDEIKSEFEKCLGIYSKKNNKIDHYDPQILKDLIQYQNIVSETFESLETYIGFSEGKPSAPAATMRRETMANASAPPFTGEEEQEMTNPVPTAPFIEPEEMPEHTLHDANSFLRESKRAKNKSIINDFTTSRGVDKSEKPSSIRLETSESKSKGESARTDERIARKSVRERRNIHITGRKRTPSKEFLTKTNYPGLFAETNETGLPCGPSDYLQLYQAIVESEPFIPESQYKEYLNLTKENNLEPVEVDASKLPNLSNEEGKDQTELQKTESPGSKESIFKLEVEPKKHEDKEGLKGIVWPEVPTHKPKKIEVKQEKQEKQEKQKKLVG